MKTLPMPAVAKEAPDLDTFAYILDQCCDILKDYREEGCPGFPKSNPFVDRLMAIGVTVEEACEILSRTWQNTEEVA